MFYQEIAHYNDFGGTVIEVEEGARLAQALGNCKSAILQNHGILTTGSTIESAVQRFIAYVKTAFDTIRRFTLPIHISWDDSLEHECHTQLLADAAAAGLGTTTKKISHEEAEFTHRTTGTEPALYFMASVSVLLVHYAFSTTTQVLGSYLALF